MPVHFKGSSEYKTHYQWTDSFKSQSFEPTDQQAASRAGQASVSSSLTVEPPLQHKKRLDGPSTSLSYSYLCLPNQAASNDFALLGQQEKFASNVRYKPKGTLAAGKIYKNKENLDDAPPPSKQLKMQKKAKADPVPVASKPDPPAPEPVAPLNLASPPPAPREPLKEPLKDKDLKDILEPNKPASVKESSSNMNEFVQTNMKKGIADSAPEAPAEYALKFKAGVAPPRPVKKFSEYQRQFQWKDGKKASPLLAAEEIVHQSHADLGPYKTEAIPKQSEYNRQYQKWKIPADVNFDVKPEPSEKRPKRSKSAGAALKEKPEAAEPAVEAAPSETKLKAKLSKSHGKIKLLGSEYKANFKSPLKYSAPPQMTPAAADVNNNAEASEVPAEIPLNNWFAEVLELRRRAAEYGRRARGTHFSRQHVGQLMGQQAKAWDLPTPSRDVQALDLEVPAAGRSSKMDSPVEVAAPAAVAEMEAVEEAQPPSAGRQSRKEAWLEQHQEAVAQQQSRIEEAEKQLEAEADTGGLEDAAPAEAEEAGGRLPTPVIKAGSSSGRRHHLDLTTPSLGGALLTCPPAASAHHIVTSRSGDSYVTMSDDIPAKKEPKFNTEQLVTAPAGGKVTEDTHALRDEAASSDRGLATQYIASPQLGSKAKKPSNLTIIPEGQGKTFLSFEDVKAQTGVCNKEDDVLSLSLMSVASSGSLASQVLDRAKKRQEFWSKKA